MSNFGFKADSLNLSKVTFSISILDFRFWIESRVSKPFQSHLHQFDFGFWILDLWIESRVSRSFQSHENPSLYRPLADKIRTDHNRKYLANPNRKRVRKSFI